MLPAFAGAAFAAQGVEKQLPKANSYVAEIMEARRRASLRVVDEETENEVFP